MNRLVVFALAATSVVGCAVLGFIAGQRAEAARNAFARQVETVQSHQLHAIDLASKDPATREGALWYQVGAVLYGTDPLTSMLNESARTREAALTYARLSELAASQGQSERAVSLLLRAESLCPRMAWPQCSGAEILTMVRRLAEVEASSIERLKQ